MTGRRSAGQWIVRNVPAGRSRLRKLMREYFSEEFGLDARRLTATDLLYLTEGPHHGREHPTQGCYLLESCRYRTAAGRDS